MTEMAKKVILESRLFFLFQEVDVKTFLLSSHAVVEPAVCSLGTEITFNFNFAKSNTYNRLGTEIIFNCGSTSEHFCNVIIIIGTLIVSQETSLLRGSPIIGLL